MINSFSQEVKIREPLVFLALGDSYTIGQSVPEKDRWPVQLGERLRNLGVNVQEIEIRARTGWTTTNLLSSLETDTITINPNLVSLLIGVNNQYQGRSINEYTEEFEELLLKALNYVENDSQLVFVVSIPDYAYTPFGGGADYISRELDDFNEINKSISEKYQVPYINITGISREGLLKPEYVAGDGLHPSGIQYERWVDKILTYIPLTGVTKLNTQYSPAIYEVFPNPFSDRLNVKSNKNFEDGSLYVADITGKEIFSKKFSGDEVLLDLGFLEKGLYFLTIIDGSHARSIKILKK